MKYVIITPAKNEEKYIRNTLDSVLAQTVRPERWIIVDDGSSDHTTHIVEEYTEKYGWIELIKKDTREEMRSGGSKVVRAFNEGFEKVKGQDFNVIVKLDADLTLPPDYFEKINDEFLNSPKTGLCGGYCLIEKNGVLVKESYSENHVRGAFKAYRRECFKDIGGLKPIWSWDGMDELILWVKGWDLRVLPLPIVHHRPTSQEYNLFRYSFKSGAEMYRVRTDFISLLYFSCKQFTKKPVVIGSILYILGYFMGAFVGEERIIDKELAKSIKKYRYRKKESADRIRR